MSDIKIYGKLVNATTDNKLAGADQIYDSTQSKFQSEINALIPKLEGGKIPSNYLPSYVDDVLEGTYVNETTFNVTSGEPKQTGVIYVDTTTNISYRYSGSKYIKISSPLELGTSSSTALAGSEGIKGGSVTTATDSVTVALTKNSNDKIQITIPKANGVYAGMLSGSDQSLLFTLRELVANHKVALFDDLDIIYQDTDGLYFYRQYFSSGDHQVDIQEVKFPVATTTMDGVMSSQDKKNLNTLLTNAIKSISIEQSTDQVGISLVSNPSNPTIDAILPAASTNSAGVMTSQDKKDIASLKLSTIGYLGIDYSDNQVAISLAHNQGSTTISEYINAATSSNAGVMSKQDKVNLDTVYYDRYTDVELTATPSIIEKFGVNQVVLGWKSTFKGNTFTPETTKVTQVISEGTETSITSDHNSTSVQTISDSATYKVKITYKGITKEDTIKVNAYYPKYYGFSSNPTITSDDILDTNRFTKQSISGTAIGEGSINAPFPSYMWFCIPNDMTINKVTSSGIEVPMEAPVNVVVTDRGTYKCYRSSNVFKVGIFNYQIS